MMIKTIIALSAVCFATALPLNEENPWTRVFDDQEDDFLDFVENGEQYNEKNCCGVIDYEYMLDKDICIRKVAGGKLSKHLKKKIEQEHFKKITMFLGERYLLYDGNLYQKQKPSKHCYEI